MSRGYDRTVLPKRQISVTRPTPGSELRPHELLAGCGRLNCSHSIRRTFRAFCALVRDIWADGIFVSSAFSTGVCSPTPDVGKNCANPGPLPKSAAPSTRYTGWEPFIANDQLTDQTRPISPKTQLDDVQRRAAVRVVIELYDRRVVVGRTRGLYDLRSITTLDDVEDGRLV